MKLLILSFALFICVSPCSGQFSQAERDSIARLSAEDHKLMKEQLDIRVPNRPGPSGNPTDPNAANSDETKVNSYVLPDPLKFNSGEKVQTSQQWWDRRRPEIIELFEREIYGREPANIPAVTWKIISSRDTVVGNFPVKERMISGIVDNSTMPGISVEIELLIVTPLSASDAVPLVLEFGFIRSPFDPPPATSIFSPGEPDWKEQIISRGWGFGILNPASIQEDHGAGLNTGIIGLVNQGKPRKPDDWGTLRAWAWGAGKVLDYLESDQSVDANRVAIAGLSRYGKAAVVALAFEPRFSLGFIGSSGAGGTKILRRNFGEQVENLASSYEYHWFAGNFIKYASGLTTNDLPVDAHELVALCAPRPIFISVGSPFVEGTWVDARGMFLAGVHAGPVYQLIGKKGMNITEFPALGTAVTDGDIAFRQHAGGHTMGPNWSTMLAWASGYWAE